MISNISSNNMSQVASNMFANLDTTNKGYLEEEDFQSAFSSISVSEDEQVSLFSQLDSDADGKVTEDEMVYSLEQIFGNANNAMPPPPPPPPPSNTESTGYTKDELISTLEEIGDSDEKRSSLISNIIENFDEADTDGDGVVTHAEAMAFDQALNGETNMPPEMAGMAPPPPPPSNDESTGYTQDELVSMLDEIGDSDDQRSSLISNIIENFDEADTDGDGVVSHEEAMSFDQSTNTDNSSIIQKLIEAYGDISEIDSTLISQVA